MIVNGFICDNKKCNKQVSWDADEIKVNPNAMPDHFYKFCNWQPIYEEPTTEGREPTSKVYQFCSVECNLTFLRGRTNPYSPREKAMITANNRQVDEARAKELESRKLSGPGVTPPEPYDSELVSGGNA